MIFQQQKYLLHSPFTCLASIIFILRKSSCQETAYLSYHRNVQSCAQQKFIFSSEKPLHSGLVQELVHCRDKRYFYFHLCIGISSQRLIVIVWC